jgi:hypothetical protein
METPVIVDTSKVAVSDGPLGGPPGVQFAAVFQSILAGFASHVALPAKLLLAVESRSVRMAAAVRTKAHARERKSEGISLPWKDLHNRSDCMILIAIYLKVVQTNPERSRFFGAERGSGGTLAGDAQQT